MSDVWPEHRFVAPGETAASVTDRLAAFVLRERMHLWWLGAFGLAMLLVAMCVVAVFWPLYFGIDVWGDNWPAVWGLADIDYDWFIEVSTGCAFIAAAGMVFRQDWRPGLSRFAEAIAVCAVIGAGISPIVHLGRQGFFYWLYPYPNVMATWPNFRSPLEWDFFNIQSFAACAVLFFYFGLVPDLATLRDRAGSRLKQMIYGAAALGFRGSGVQWRRYRAVHSVLACVMMCSSVLMAGIAGLDLAGSQVVGWHSTQEPVAFAFGAVLAGSAMLLLLIPPLRTPLDLHRYITERHIDVLCRIMLAASICFAYTYLVDAFNAFYSSDPREHSTYVWRITGPYAPAYWVTVAFEFVLPHLLWFRPLRLNRPLLGLVSLAVLIGMYIYHYDAVEVGQMRNHMPSSWGYYHATYWDWFLLFGLLGVFFAAFLLFVRLLPVLPMHEMRALVRRRP